MLEFFAWMVLVCVVPFVFAILELQFKEVKRPRLANRGNEAGIGSPSIIISFTTEQRGNELVRVVHTTALTARWRDRGSLWARSEGDAVFKELLLHEIGLSSAPIGEKMRRSVVLKSSIRQHQERLRRSGWTSLN